MITDVLEKNSVTCKFSVIFYFKTFWDLDLNHKKIKSKHINFLFSIQELLFPNYSYKEVQLKNPTNFESALLLHYSTL